MNGYLSDYQIARMLNDIRANCYIGLAFDNPNIAGAYASEISGKGYVRQRMTFTAPASRTIWSTATASFTGLPESRVTHVVGWNARLKGDYLFACELETPQLILEGRGFSLAGGTIAVSFGTLS